MKNIAFLETKRKGLNILSIQIFFELKEKTMHSFVLSFHFIHNPVPE